MNFKNWLNILESKGGATTRLVPSDGVTRRSTYLGVGGYFGDPSTPLPTDKAMGAIPAGIGDAMAQHFKNQGAIFTPAHRIGTPFEGFKSREAFHFSLPLQLPATDGLDDSKNPVYYMDLLKPYYSSRLVGAVKRIVSSPVLKDPRIRTINDNPPKGTTDARHKFWEYSDEYPNLFDLAVAFTRSLIEVIVTDRLKEERAYNKYDLSKPDEVKEVLKNNILTCTLIFRKKEHDIPDEDDDDLEMEPEGDK